MEKIKIVLLSFLAAFLIVVPFGNSSVYAKEKVKVYIFEAGGCPYCEAEVEYLESLDSYGEKFEIVRKQLYIDHVDWEPGEDYLLGESAANLFQEYGFSDAVITGTPFVIISNLYAAASYSEQLESVIDEAYNKGDADVVGCIADGGSDCMPEPVGDGSEVLATIISIILIAGLVFLVFTTRTQARNEKNDGYLLLESEIDEDEEVEEHKEKETKSTKTRSKTSDDSKKTSKKTTSKKINKNKK